MVIQHCYNGMVWLIPLRSPTEVNQFVIATSPPHMYDSVVLARLRQCAPHLINVLPPGVQIPNGISIVSRSLQPFLHSSTQNVPIVHNGPPLPPSKLFLLIWGDLHLSHGSLVHRNPQPTRHLDLFSFSYRAHYCDRQADRQTTPPGLQQKPHLRM